MNTSLRAYQALVFVASHLHLLYTADMISDAPKTLHSAGLKVTIARQEILRLFSGHCKPMDADTVFKKVEKFGINHVTVYRTLATLETSGILRRVDLRRDSVYYEPTTHHHHHIICTHCGTIEEFHACSIDQLTKRILAQSPRFSSINEHSLELFGACKKCSK